MAEGGRPRALYTHHFSTDVIQSIDQLVCEQGMEIVFRRVYGVSYAPHAHGEHDHDDCEAEEEGRRRGPLLSTHSRAANGDSLKNGSHHHHHHHEEEENKAGGPPVPHTHSHSNAHYGSVGDSESLPPNGGGASASLSRRSSSVYSESHIRLLPEQDDLSDMPAVGARLCYHHTEERHIVAAFQTPGKSVLTAMMMELGGCVR